MKSKLLKKLCAISLAALMIGGAGLTEIGSFVSASLPIYAATAETPSSFQYEENDDGSITITSFIGSETEVIIPRAIDGKKVTSIGRMAFGYRTSLTSVTIPDSVTSIAENVFYGCKKLTIKGKKGSYVETYAKNNDIPFTAITFPVSNISAISSATIALGDSVTVKCDAEEGTAPYTYAVYYRKVGTTKWTTAQGYKTNATVDITPKAAVDYEIRVAVKDADGKIVRKDMTLKVNKALKNTSKLGSDTIKLGEKVKVRCFATGGIGDYQYAVYYKKSTSEKWTKLRGYGTSNIIMLTPKAAVPYDVRVDIKDSSGKVVSKTLDLKVTK